MQFELKAQILDVIETYWTDDDNKTQKSTKLQTLIHSGEKYSVWEIKTDKKTDLSEIEKGQFYNITVELKNSAKYGMSLKLVSIN